MMSIRLALAVSVVLLTQVCQSAEAPRKVASVAGITEYDLDNGLRVLLFPDNSKPR